jgi:hypothetical protein
MHPKEHYDKMIMLRGLKALQEPTQPYSKMLQDVLKYYIKVKSLNNGSSGFKDWSKKFQA